MPLVDDTLHTLHILSIRFHPETVKKETSSSLFEKNVPKAQQGGKVLCYVCQFSCLEQRNHCPVYSAVCLQHLSSGS